MLCTDDCIWIRLSRLIEPDRSGQNTGLISCDSPSSVQIACAPVQVNKQYCIFQSDGTDLTLRDQRNISISKDTIAW